MVAGAAEALIPPAEATARGASGMAARATVALTALLDTAVALTSAALFAGLGLVARNLLSPLPNTWRVFSTDIDLLAALMAAGLDLSTDTDRCACVGPDAGSRTFRADAQRLCLLARSSTESAIMAKLPVCAALLAPVLAVAWGCLLAETRGDGARARPNTTLVAAPLLLRLLLVSGEADMRACDLSGLELGVVWLLADLVGLHEVLLPMTGLLEAVAEGVVAAGSTSSARLTPARSREGTPLRSCACLAVWSEDQPGVTSAPSARCKAAGACARMDLTLRACADVLAAARAGEGMLLLPGRLPGDCRVRQGMRLGPAAGAAAWPEVSAAALIQYNVGPLQGLSKLPCWAR